MGECDEDYIINGPPLEYVARYTSVGKFIFDRLQKDPTFVGQIEADTGVEYTFAEILDRSIRLALWLQDMGVGPGDVVAYVTRNHKDVIIVVYATLFLGAVLSPWDPLLATQDIVHFMEQTKPKILICSKDAANSVERAAEDSRVAPVFVVHGELSGFISFEDTQIHSKTRIDDFRCAEVEENDVALFVCTSGTSASPKIMQRTHKAILMKIQNLEKQPYVSPVFLTFAPVCWVSGMFDAFLGPCGKFQRVVAPYLGEESIFKWIEQYQVTTMTVSSRILMRLVSCDAISKYDVSTLRAIIFGGDVTTTWHDKIFEKFAPVGCKLFHVYGMTEIAGGSVSIGLVLADNPGSCGTLTKGMSGKIIDPRTEKPTSPYELGELCLKYPGMFAGYYNDPELTKAVLDSEGWLHTGDLAKFNGKGELFVFGRIKDVIQVNGRSVFPPELEGILAKHPGVQHVGVVGKRVSSDVEHPVAFLVKTIGSNVTEAELCNFLKEQDTDDAKELQGGVRFIHQMPQSTSGKIKRWELRKMLESEM